LKNKKGGSSMGFLPHVWGNIFGSLAVLYIAGIFFLFMYLMYLAKKLKPK
jgi:hypothetical protein